MSGFTKVSPGQACKVADAFSTGWTWPQKGSMVQEAREEDGSLVAYLDGNGFFCHHSLANLDLSDIAA